MSKLFHTHKKSYGQDPLQKPLFEPVESFEDYLSVSDAKSFIEQCFSFPLDKKKLQRKAFAVNEATFRYCNSCECSAGKMCQFFQTTFGSNLQKFLKSLAQTDDTNSDQDLENSAGILMGLLQNWKTMQNLCAFAFKSYDEIAVLDFNARIVTVRPYFPDFIRGKEDGCATTVSSILDKMFQKDVLTLLPTRVKPLWEVIMESYGKWRGNKQMQDNIDFFCKMLITDNKDSGERDLYSIKYIDCVINSCTESLTSLSNNCVDAESGLKLAEDCLLWISDEVKIAEKRIPVIGADALKARICDLVRTTADPILCSISLSLLRNRMDFEIKKIHNLFHVVSDEESISFFSRVFAQFVLGECYSFVEDSICDKTFEDVELFITKFSEKEKELNMLAKSITDTGSLNFVVKDCFKNIFCDNDFCLSHLPSEFTTERMDRARIESLFNLKD